ncbi:MAG TPA: LamG-like jellyroll fold domain-containing protein [Kofleriaceae bacterium]|nr:LamG-like jellyroll fold domain-containing protein [Kofleriaceae bacterium]
MHRLAVLALLVGACSFHAVGKTNDAPRTGDAAAHDASPDAPADAAPPPFCPADPHLRLCFDFDAPTLPASYPDQGVATASAQLTNVTRIASPLGGAAQLGTQSEIYFPMDTAVSNILASEIYFRIDTDAAADGSRESLFDSNLIPPNISMFVYRNDPDHDIHCGIGSQNESWTTSAITLATWHHALCICANGNLSLYLDGTNLGDRAGNCGTGGSITSEGFTIGSNNNGGPTGVNELLLGAIDGIRLWDQPPPP